MEPNILDTPAMEMTAGELEAMLERVFIKVAAFGAMQSEIERRAMWMEGGELELSATNIKQRTDYCDSMRNQTSSLEPASID